MDDSPGLSKADLSEHEQELILEVRDLQRRVANLEEHVGIVVPVSTSVATSHPAALPKLNVSAEAVPIIGKALLGIAGAYLLRALTELGVLPQTPGVAVGILYAILWLWVAARLPAERKLAITVNGLTSVLILAPLLWEATIRFHAISSRTTAATIAAFFLIGQALSWRKNLTVIFGIASVFSALIAMALLIATNDLLPFTLSLLVIAGGVEFAAYRDRAPGPRWLVAAMADLAVVIFSALISRKEGLPEGYVSASLPSALIAQGLLLIIYVASIGSRTLVYHRLFTSVEIAQMAFAFLIGLALFRLSKGIAPLHPRSRCSPRLANQELGDAEARTT